MFNTERYFCRLASWHADTNSSNIRTAHRQVRLDMEMKFIHTSLVSYITLVYRPSPCVCSPLYRLDLFPPFTQNPAIV